MTSREVIRYLIRRVVAVVGLLIVISFAVFTLVHLVPGSPADTLMGTQPRTDAAVRTLEEQHHLDKPFLSQYWLWARSAVKLDFGESIQTSLPVTDEIRSRLPRSILLACYAYLLTVVIGVSVGTLAALRRGSLVDRGLVAASVVGLSTPAFVSGVLLIYLFSVMIRGLFPAFGPGDGGILDEIWHLTLPAVALALVGGAYIVKHTRAGLLSVIDQDYVLFARARGLSPWTIWFAYGLRNALIPVITVSAPLLAFLITGAVLVEVTFSLPGLGQLLVEAATTKDIPMLQGIALVVATVILVANLLGDLLYLAVDPRIRLGRSAS